MRPDKLLDAIGLIDDRHFEEKRKSPAVPWRRRLIALAAAVLMMLLSVGVAMAVSAEFRELVFSVFDIKTHEQPPAGNTDTLPAGDRTGPSQSGLNPINEVTIDGIVHAHYFTSEGIVLTCEGGFYTCAPCEANAAPEDGTFWEIRTDGIVDVGAARIDFPLSHGSRMMQIIFDYAILNGKLNIKVWHQNMNEDPVGDGWNVEPIGDRTDIALMTVPVHTGTDYTHDLLLLDLATLEATDLLGSIPRDNMVVDAGWVTDDLRYAILSGVDRENSSREYWFYDLELKTVTTVDALTGTNSAQPYFLNDSTIIFRESLGGGRFNVVSHHIPTGIQRVIVENTTGAAKENPGYRGIQRNGSNGRHGLLFREDGSADLIDLWSHRLLNITGLDGNKLTTSESPDGARILIAYEETNENGELGYGFSKLGILDPETGVLQMLTRDISGTPESFGGWIDGDTLAITAHDPAGAYYVYLYEFSKG